VRDKRAGWELSQCMYKRGEKEKGVEGVEISSHGPSTSLVHYICFAGTHTHTHTQWRWSGGFGPIESKESRERPLYTWAQFNNESLFRPVV
jgi:hypothetical protein